MNLPVWGISKWRDYEQCPAMYHAKHITKQWVDAPNDAMLRGQRVHKAFEDAVKYDLQLPAELEKYQGFVDSCVAAKVGGATVVPEFKVGMTTGYERCDYFKHPSLRVRAAFDLYMEKDRHVNLVDYKTGKPKQEHRDDAEFYASAAHMITGSLRTEMAYLYVDQPEASFSIVVGDAPMVMSNWYRKFNYADKLIASGDIPMEQCNACSWCGNATCPKNRNKKLGNG